MDMRVSSWLLSTLQLPAFLWMQLLLFLGVYWEVDLLCCYSPPSPSQIYSSALLPFLEDWVPPRHLHSVFLWTLINSDDFLILRAILWLSYCEWFMLMAFFLLFFLWTKKRFLLNFSFFVTIILHARVCYCWTVALLLSCILTSEFLPLWINYFVSNPRFHKQLFLIFFFVSYLSLLNYSCPVQLYSLPPVLHFQITS